MTFNLLAILAAIGSGLATALGALPIYLKKEFSKEFLDVGMGFSAGVMIVAAFTSLIIPGLQESRVLFTSTLGAFGFIPVIIGIVIGYLCIIFIHDYLPHEHLYKKTDMGHGKTFSRMSLIVLAIAIHNFPEGLSVGVGFGSPSDTTNGYLLALAIAIQNIPEGLVVALGLLREGASKNRAFKMAVLSGLVEPVAALMGYLSTQIATKALPMALGFAGGMMLFVICQEIFPELFRQGSERKTTLGVITGICLMIVLDYIFNS